MNAIIQALNTALAFTYDSLHLAQKPAEHELCECGRFEISSDKVRCWKCDAEEDDELTERFGHIDDNQ